MCSSHFFFKIYYQIIIYVFIYHNIQRTGKRSNSRSRKGEHESKIKSTVVVTRPRSPAATSAEPTESKKKSEGNWEDDSDGMFLKFHLNNIQFMLANEI